MSSTVIEPITQTTPLVPSQRGTGAWLVVSRGPQSGAGVALDEPLVTIGRHPSNQIALGDPTVSARHAQIQVDGDRYFITDVGSLNGTYVNRQPVDRAELRDGDEIWLGRHRLLFRIGAR